MEDPTKIIIVIGVIALGILGLWLKNDQIAYTALGGLVGYLAPTVGTTLYKPE